MSPYLFILCSEVLSRILPFAEQQGLIHGIQIARAAPSNNHQMFADDITIFLRANTNEATQLKACLDKYHSWSGQEINYQKFGIFTPLMPFKKCGNQFLRC